MKMYFVQIQLISDTLNPYKSPIWPKTESVGGYFLICKNFNPAVKQLAVSAAKLQNTRLSLNKLEEEHFCFGGCF